MSRYTYNSSDDAYSGRVTNGGRAAVPDSEYYRMRRERGYEGPQSDVTRSHSSSRPRSVSRTYTSSSSSSHSDDEYSYYTGYTDTSLSHKNVDAPRQNVFIPAAYLPQLTSKRDIQIEQPAGQPLKPLPPKKAPRPRLEEYWQPNLNIMGSDAEPVVIEGFRQIAAKAVVKYRQEEDICGKIKYDMDRKFGRPWCCIYGGNFDSFVTHDGGMFIYFKLENKFGLLWRNRFK